MRQFFSALPVKPILTIRAQQNWKFVCLLSCYLNMTVWIRITISNYILQTQKYLPCHTPLSFPKYISFDFPSLKYVSSLITNKKLGIILTRFLNFGEPTNLDTGQWFTIRILKCWNHRFNHYKKIKFKIIFIMIPKHHTPCLSLRQAT